MNKGSTYDITLYHNLPNEVLELLAYGQGERRQRHRHEEGPSVGDHMGVIEITS